jgi:WD40 repeat protein
MEGSIRIWDAMTGLETLEFKGDFHRASAVAFSPDGHRLAAISSETTVKVWDARPLDHGVRVSESGTR